MPRLAKAVDGALELGFSLALQITVARKKQQRISTDGGGSLTQNPFDALDGLEVAPDPPADSLLREPCVEPEKTSKRGKKNKNRGRVDIIRQTAHRGGKTVTVACNFPPIGEAEKKDLAKKMQKACSVGGTVKDGNIEIQGDKRTEMKQILIEAGFRPVFAGG